MIPKPKGPRLTIRVDQDLIDFSRGRDSSHCMIAEAIRDARPDVKSISVDLQTIRFSIPKKRIRCIYLTPRIAQLALIRFDQGQMPDEFQFQLRGAHVTAMADRTSQAAPRARSSSKAKGNIEKARTATIRQSGGGRVAERVGGKAPPTTPFARRRAFGLRALEY